MDLTNVKLELDDFNELRDLVRRHTGISLADNKVDLVKRRLTPRMRTLGIPSFRAYIEYLKSGHQQEILSFSDAITTNLTYFFREEHHFEMLSDLILPAFAKNHGRYKPFRAWSAGCSSGEEAYSMAMVMREFFGMSGNVEILATDLDQNCLRSGRDGVYRIEQMDKVGQERLARWFMKGKGGRDGFVKAKKELVNLIKFERLNLMESWPGVGQFDVIFCRNVMIYFDKPTQKRLVERFADHLKPGGHLIVGHSEMIQNMSSRIRLLGKTVYEKVG
ncbi:protein-glutamate O-methyltransferase CheR [Porticoccaceae bacterium LTM1]|nr:protein-glutamate O-methyltransferase CheR [Porticoccaceae bacterium LTM1]